jgi:hypothetical protein
MKRKLQFIFSYNGLGLKFDKYKLINIFFTIL